MTSTPSTKTRADLKAYFVKNAIPTEGNFADLIDAQLNLADDGLRKEPGQPWGLVAAGGEERRVLELYPDLAATDPDWRLALNPKDPADPSNKAAGLGIADRRGDTRLLLGRDGKLSVVGELSVAGGLSASLPGGDAWSRFAVSFTNLWTGAEGRFATLGAGEAAGIMFYNPHVVWQDNEKRASLRYGIVRGPGAGVWWDVGVREDAAFTFKAGAQGEAETLRIAPNGDLTVKGGLYASDSDLYFTRTDHKHTGIGNKPGCAAIENSQDYNALMILGRATDQGRVVRLWDRLTVEGALDVKGGLSVVLPSGALTPPDGNDWRRLTVAVTKLWDGQQENVTLGAAGAAGIMLHNPHVVWQAGEQRASLRYGVTRGPQPGVWWDAGVRADATFSFKAGTRGEVEVLKLAPSGDLTVAGNLAAHNVTCSGNGGVFNVVGTDHAYLQWFPQGAAAGRKAWIGYGNASATTMTLCNQMPNGDIALDGRVVSLPKAALAIGNWLLEADATSLRIKCGDQTVARFSTEHDSLLLFQNRDGKPPYFCFNRAGECGLYDGRALVRALR